MNINRLSTAPATFEVSGNGSSVVCTVGLPGVVRVLTPGAHHVLVGPIPFYADCELAVSSFGVAFRRSHVRYRFDKLVSEPSPAERAAVLDVVFAAVSDLAAAESKLVGVFVEPGDVEEVRDQLAKVSARVAQAEAARARAVGKVEAAVEHLSAVDGHLVELRAEQERLSALLP